MHVNPLTSSSELLETVECWNANAYGFAFIAEVIVTFAAGGHRHMPFDGVADGLLDYYSKLGCEPTLLFERYTYDVEESG